MSAHRRQSAAPEIAGRRARIAAIHVSGARTRVVVLAPGSPARLIDAATFPEGDEASVRSLLRRHRPESVVRVVPAGRTIARTREVDLPGEADPEARAGALRLIAESELPFIPPHRLGAGLLEGPGASRSALFTGWADRAAPAGEPDPAPHPGEASWISEIAALACLAPIAGHVRAAADPSTGSIGLVAGGAGGLRARALVGDAGDEKAWEADVTRVVREAIESCGCADPGRIDASLAAPLLVLHPHERAALAQRIDAMPSDPSWIDAFAVSLGAALCASSDDPLVRSLATLTPRAAQRREGVIARARAWISHPLRASWVIAASLLVALLAPWALARARVEVLRARVAALEASGAGDDLALRAALYEQLTSARWNMTGLLADVASAAPVGLRAESIRIDRSQGVRIACTADEAALITDFQRSLASQGVFRGVLPERIESDASGAVESVLTADVARPHAPVRPMEDFAARPLAVRLYGEGASNERFDPEGSERPRASAPRARTRGGAAQPDDEPVRPLARERAVGPGASDAPPALDDDAIGALDRPAAMREWAARKRFLDMNPRVPQELRTRIEAEIAKLRRRFSGGDG